jgi:hypothetical protein
MEFFLPATGGAADPQSLLSSLRMAAQGITRRPATDRRILALQYWLDGKQFDAEVGKPLTQVGLRHDQEGEVVVAILETLGPDRYLVFTRTRGVEKGQPVVVDAEESFGLVEFDP